MATGTIQQIRDRVLQLAREIEDLSQSGVPPRTFFRRFLELVVDALGASGGVIFLLDGSNRLSPFCDVNLDKTGFHDNPDANPRNEKLLANVVSTGEASTHSPQDTADIELPTEHLTILAPLQCEKQCAGVVEIFQRPDAPAEARPGYLQFVEQMCGFASRYLDRQKESQTPARSEKFWGEFEQFVLQIQRSLKPTEIASTAANDGRLVLDADRVSMALRRGKKTSVIAISGQDAVNQRSNLVQVMKVLARRVIETGEPIVYAGKIDQLPPQLEEPLANYIQESGSRMLIAMPLFAGDPLIGRDDDEKQKKKEKTRRKRAIGCLLVEQVAESKPQPKLAERSELLADHVAAALNNALKHQRVFLLPLWGFLGRILEWFHGRKLAKLAAVVTLLTAIGLGLAFVPMDYRVTAEGRLMPVIQHEVFTPLDGDVVDILVQDGETVEQGQPLVQLHNDDLEAQLLSTQSDLQERRQEIETLQAAIDIAIETAAERDRVKQLHGEQEVARIRIKGLNEQLAVLKKRVSLLTIRSPIAGVVATFHVQQLLRNRPVTRGEMLLEIMDDSGDWRLELDVDENRMGHLLRARQKAAPEALLVEFILATKTEDTYKGRLREISTRAVAGAEGGSVFEVVASLDRDQLPEHRIGSEVRAKISCGKRSAGYVFFGDVIEFVRQRLWL